MDPAVRASDDDRQQVVRALERHTTAGRLRLDEFDVRVAAALEAVTLGDLAALTRDLPPEPAPPATVAGRTGPDPGAEARSLVLAFVLAAITLVVLGTLLAVAR